MPRGPRGGGVADGRAFGTDLADLGKNFCEINNLQLQAHCMNGGVVGGELIFGSRGSGARGGTIQPAILAVPVAIWGRERAGRTHELGVRAGVTPGLRKAGLDALSSPEAGRLCDAVRRCATLCDAVCRAKVAVLSPGLEP